MLSTLDTRVQSLTSESFRIKYRKRKLRCNYICAISVYEYLYNVYVYNNNLSSFSY